MSETPQEQVTTILGDIESIGTDVAQAATAVSTAGLWSAICGFFTALPGMVSMAQDFFKWLDAISGNNPQAFIAKIGPIFSQWANAKTQGDRDAATKNLASSIFNLPS